MSASPKTQVTVVVADSHKDKLKQVKKSLQSAGMSRIEPLESLHMFTGEIDANAKAKLEKIPGVEAVEESQPVQLPPPDADIQ